MTPQKIPTTVITGFLGAGKTTLIRHMLENAEGRRIALIINEFGDVGVDSEVLMGCGDDLCKQEDIVELANGCICCTVADDFIPTMQRLIDRDEAPEHIVIETSGLALPQPLVKAFNWPEIRSHVTVDGVVTVVDGPALASGRFAHDEHAIDAQRRADPDLDHESPLHELFEDQLGCADMILLNKSDLLEDGTIEKLSGDLQPEIRPGARLVPTSHGKVDVTALLGVGAAVEDDLDTRKSHHELAGEEDHDHDDFETFFVELGDVDDREALISRIEATIREHEILRLKGFASLVGAPGRLLIQAVGPRVNSYFDRPWSEGEQRRSSIVVIGFKGMDEAAITAAITG